MLSETKIKDIQEGLLKLYNQIEDELLVSVVKSINYNADIDLTNISDWKDQQINNIPVLKKRNKNIILKHTEDSKEKLAKLYGDMAFESLKDDESIFEKAVEQGLLKSQVPVADSPAINRVIKKATEQGLENLNLVNTTATDAALSEFRNIINTTFIQVDSGLVDYKTAIRRSVLKLADKGITGRKYITNGKEYNYPIESAVRREIITSSLQSARDVQDERFKEYGVELIEVTSHVGARPKCAVDQGQIYSIGKKHKKYKSFDTTTYGDLDGLFGINCNHQKFPFIEGLSEQTYFPYPKKENEKVYKESQIQRRLEVGIRKNKRRLIALEETGDIDGFRESSVQLKQREADLKAFMKRTGRTQQPRTQLPGFNRSISQKAVHAAKKQSTD